MASHISLIAHFFTSERPRLLRRAFRLLRNRDDAEDLVQDVFVKLLRTGPRLGDLAAPRHYLNRTATNAALDHLRRQAVRAAVIDPEARPESLTDPSPTIEARLQSRQELALLQEAVAALPLKCRVVFLLSREHGLSMREIAEELAISERTVEKHILKAMSRCREALRRAGREI